MKTKQKKKTDPHIGTWGGIDEFQTNLEYTIRKKNGGYKVTVVDTCDGETPDIFEEKWEEEKGIFSFAAHWNSTGRFMRCKMQLITPDKIEFTYTYTDSETLLKKKK